MLLYVVCSARLRDAESVSRWTSTSALMSAFIPATGRTCVRSTLAARSLLSRPTSSHTSSPTPNRSEHLVLLYCIISLAVVDVMLGM